MWIYYQALDIDIKKGVAESQTVLYRAGPNRALEVSSYISEREKKVRWNSNVRG